MMTMVGKMPINYERELVEAAALLQTALIRKAIP